METLTLALVHLASPDRTVKLKIYVLKTHVKMEEFALAQALVATLANAQQDMAAKTANNKIFVM